MPTAAAAAAAAAAAVAVPAGITMHCSTAALWLLRHFLGLEDGFADLHSTGTHMQVFCWLL
jgi:hypothetical protein